MYAIRVVLFSLLRLLFWMLLANQLSAEESSSHHQMNWWAVLSPLFAIVLASFLFSIYDIFRMPAGSSTSYEQMHDESANYASSHPNDTSSSSSPHSSSSSASASSSPASSSQFGHSHSPPSYHGSQQAEGRPHVHFNADGGNNSGGEGGMGDLPGMDGEEGRLPLRQWNICTAVCWSVVLGMFLLFVLLLAVRVQSSSISAAVVFIPVFICIGVTCCCCLCCCLPIILCGQWAAASAIIHGADQQSGNNSQQQPSSPSPAHKAPTSVPAYDLD